MAQPARKERKVVTVVFADLVGFTERAETLDPEDVEAILSPYHTRLRSELERFGGTVEKFIGDAVMAVFGAPTAREDDPERAVRAALAIRDWAADSEGLEVRIAVATGEALVSLDARPESGEGMVAGDVVNTAARLQSAAPVNGVLVGEATRRATSTVIDYEVREPVSAKGKAQPVPVWEAVAARARFGLDPGQRGGAAFVGRADELGLLVDALARAKRERSPQLLTLVGVPGIGKSRLVYELFKRVERGDELTYWRQGRTLPYGEGVSFWALSEIAKAHAGILETDGAEDAEAKLRRSLAETLEGSERDWVERHLRPLVGLAAEPELGGDRRVEAFAAWRRFFEGLAEHRPLVLVVEDLHWADDGVLDFIDHLVEWASGVPILVVGTARPELLDRRPGWGGGKRASATVSLSPLSDDDTARLVHELLEQSVLPAETQSALLARAGGNPLYAEEFVRMVVERGDAEGVLPESVQGIIAARLDLLGSEEKELLQDAAVVGKVFWLGALASVGGRERWAAEQALHSLERRELVVRERRSSVAGENEYAFRHVLVRDVAYGQIPRAVRGEKHALSAEWIEGLSPDRADDRAEMLAHHYLSALDLARATGSSLSSIASRARVALRDAGDRSLSLSAFLSAARYYSAALELWPQEDSERPRLLFNLGRARWHGEESGELELDAARDAFAASGDLEGEAEAEATLAQVAWIRGDSNRVSTHLARIGGLVPRLPDGRAKAQVLSHAARLHALGFELERAETLGEEALAIANRLGLKELQAFTLNNLSVARTYAGNLTGAVKLLEEAAQIAREEHSPELLRVLNNLLVAYQRLGWLQRHDETLEEFERFATELGDVVLIRFTRGSAVPFTHLDRGRWDEALRTASAFIAQAEAGEGHRLLGSCYTLRALIRHARGDSDGALADCDRSATLVDRSDPTNTYELAMCGMILLECGRREEAIELADRTVELTRSAPFFAHDVSMTFLLHALGRSDEQLRVMPEVVDSPVARATRLWASGDIRGAAAVFASLELAPFGEAFARLAAGRQFVSEGRLDEADVELLRAIELFGRMGAHRYLQEANALLSNAGARAQPG